MTLYIDSMHNRSLDFRFDDRFGSKSHGPELAFFLFCSTKLLKKDPGEEGLFSFSFLLLLCLLLDLIKEGIQLACLYILKNYFPNFFTSSSNHTMYCLLVFLISMALNASSLTVFLTVSQRFRIR